MRSLVDVLKSIAESTHESVADNEINEINELMHGERSSGSFAPLCADGAKGPDHDIERAAIMAEGAGAELNATRGWPALYRECVTAFRVLHPEQEAQRLAWGRVINLWHLEHGERTPPHLCAGCRDPIGDAKAFDLIDGCRVHDDDEHRCLMMTYGERWRGEAERALGSGALL
jgi:hypothetical protein